MRMMTWLRLAALLALFIALPVLMPSRWQDLVLAPPAAAQDTRAVSPHRTPSTSPTPYTLPGSEVRVLHSKITGFGYRLDIALPTDYATSGATTYPVFYLLDAPGTWLLAEVALQLQRLGEDPPRAAILVGIGYDTDSGEETAALRGIDMTPTPNAAWDERLRAKGYAKGSGGAPAFLRALKEEICPLIEANYRVSGERLFGGYSLGGLFGAYVLFHDPSVFRNPVLEGAPANCRDDTGCHREWHAWPQ
jgi:predicted alpha/beta superfamily hydrolase